MQIGGNLDKDAAFERSDNVKGKLDFYIDPDLLKIKYQFGDETLDYDFSRLWDMREKNIETITTEEIEEYLSYLSSVRFTFDGLISSITMRLNSEKTTFEVWLSKRRHLARAVLLKNSMALFDKGSVAKSFISEASRDRINDYVMSEYSDDYKDSLQYINELEGQIKFLDSLLKSVEQAMNCFKKIFDRRERLAGRKSF